MSSSTTNYVTCITLSPSSDTTVAPQRAATTGIALITVKTERHTVTIITTDISVLMISKTDRLTVEIGTPTEINIIQTQLTVDFRPTT